MTTLEKVKQLALEIIVIIDNGGQDFSCLIAEKIEKMSDYRLEVLKIPYIREKKNEN